ncbi:hypothetical protein ACFVWT_04555 [Arthrobacter sp. NPDC058288]|uniref:hypothetical protein n=1 Tax=Arthrobacter sp. NPDC058288 TaxID=3346424 RepID=UPI0036EB6873
MNARDELQLTIYQSNRLNTQIDLQDDRRLQGAQLAWAGYSAAAVRAAGYRKPKVLGYIVVDRSGVMVGNQQKHRESAQAFAEEWTADCRTAGIDWEYRVAEITESA